MVDDIKSMNSEPPLRSDMVALIGGKQGGPEELLKVAPPEARAAYHALIGQADRAPADLAIIEDFEIPGSDGGTIGVSLFDARAEREPGPAMVFFHGGGFVLGSVDTDASFCSHLAAGLDLPIWSVEYQLAPEHPFPAAPVDCEAATRWIAENSHRFGHKVTGLVLAGESAGGMLTIVTAMALRDRPTTVPVLLHAPIVPVLDMRLGLEGGYPSRKFYGYTFTQEGRTWVTDHYKADPADWRANPMLRDLTGMPPAFITTAELDILRDEGRADAAALIVAGNRNFVYEELQGQIHGYYLFSGAIPSIVADVDKFVSTLKRMVDREIHYYSI